MKYYSDNKVTRHNDESMQELGILDFFMVLLAILLIVTSSSPLKGKINYSIIGLPPGSVLLQVQDNGMINEYDPTTTVWSSTDPKMHGNNYFHVLCIDPITCKQLFGVTNKPSGSGSFAIALPQWVQTETDRLFIDACTRYDSCKGIMEIHSDKIVFTK
jgi:hypothetical protein